MVKKVSRFQKNRKADSSEEPGSSVAIIDIMEEAKSDSGEESEQKEEDRDQDSSSDIICTKIEVTMMKSK